MRLGISRLNRWQWLSLSCALVISIPMIACGDDPKPEAPKVEEKEKPAPPPQLFPDSGLEAAVRAEVYEKRYNKDVLTVDDVKSISRVIGKSKGIKSLSGLEHCAALMLIDLEGNEINDSPPSECEAVKPSPVVFSQNRLYAGVSYEVMKNVKFTVAYMNVYLARSSGNEFDNASVLWAILAFDNVFSQFKRKGSEVEK